MVLDWTKIDWDGEMDVKKRESERCFQQLIQKEMLARKTQREKSKAILYAKFYRKKTIVEKLAEIGLSIRDDSVICREYIDTGVFLIGSNVGALVWKMAQIHFLYNYTNYPRVQRKYFQKHGETKTLKKQYDIPKKWPWINIFDCGK
jgi:hypothetical protein